MFSLSSLPLSLSGLVWISPADTLFLGSVTCLDWLRQNLTELWHHRRQSLLIGWHRERMLKSGGGLRGERWREGWWEMERLSDAAQCLQALSVSHFELLSPARSLPGFSFSHGGNSQHSNKPLSTEPFLPFYVFFLFQVIPFSIISQVRKREDGELCPIYHLHSDLCKVCSHQPKSVFTPNPKPKLRMWTNGSASVSNGHESWHILFLDIMGPQSWQKSQLNINLSFSGACVWVWKQLYDQCSFEHSGFYLPIVCPGDVLCLQLQCVLSY